MSTIWHKMTLNSHQYRSFYKECNNNSNNIDRIENLWMLFSIFFFIVTRYAPRNHLHFPSAAAEHVASIYISSYIYVYKYNDINTLH